MQSIKTLSHLIGAVKGHKQTKFTGDLGGGFGEGSCMGTWREGTYPTINLLTQPLKPAPLTQSLQPDPTHPTSQTCPPLTQPLKPVTHSPNLSIQSPSDPTSH